MARKTVYNSVHSDELYIQILKENKELISEFSEYLQSTDKSPQTIEQYVGDLRYFFTWNLQNNNNKFFVDLNKRDIMKYQNWLLTELKLSSNRIRRLKATISSLSNFIESMMDDLYPNFRNIVNKVPAPSKQVVREKTILSDEQINFLLNYLVENKKYQAACVFALGVATGARKSELLRFKVSYFKDEYIKYGALYKTPETIKTKGRAKGKFIYKYTLVDKFKPYFDLLMNERKELGIESDVLFIKKYDGEIKPLDISTLDSYADTFSKILGVNFYWHSLRHFFTTELVKNNIPADVIKDIVGWENLEMVSLYTDIGVDDSLGKYFDADGIKKTDKKSIADI